MKKGVPNLLKILYGPHALRQASEFDDLVEVCGNVSLFIYISIIIPLHFENE